MPIDIAMPAYNCAAWMNALLDSILGQDYTEWRLIVRDDGSTDETAAILAKWNQRLGGRMTLLPGGRNLGIIENFNTVLGATTSPWVMLADPDDVWRPGKISITTTAMAEAVGRWGSSTPIAICTDAIVTDSNLSPIADSYWKWAKQSTNHNSDFNRILVDSPALGSTLIVNRALLDIALPIDSDAAYQDWWLALAACCFGKLITLREQTILYRRHLGNATDAPSTAKFGMAAIATARQRVQNLVCQYSLQAKGFLRKFDGQIPAKNLPTAKAAASISAQNALRKRLLIAQQGLWFGAPLKNIGLMVLL